MNTSTPDARDSAGAPSEFPLVLGLDTFGDVTNDDNNRPLSHAQTIRNLVEQGVLADQVGIDYFGIVGAQDGDCVRAAFGSVPQSPS